MLACLCAALSSTDAYTYYLLLKTEKQKIIFCVTQMYVLLFAIASALVHLVGGILAFVIFLVFYFCFFGYCIKTAIPYEE